MRPFEYVRAGNVDAAVALVSADPQAQYLAGGTTQIDLMLKDVAAEGEVAGKLASPALRRAIFAAATVALLALSAPLQLGIVLAIAAGITAGLTAQRNGPTQSTHRVQPATQVRR